LSQSQAAPSIRSTPRDAAEIAHRHHHHRDPTTAFSLLGTSVATRLGIVAVISVLMWGAIAWALA